MRRGRGGGRAREITGCDPAQNPRTLWWLAQVGRQAGNGSSSSLLLNICLSHICSPIATAPSCLPPPPYYHPLSPFPSLYKISFEIQVFLGPLGCFVLDLTLLVLVEVREAIHCSRISPGVLDLGILQWHWLWLCDVRFLCREGCGLLDCWM